MLSYWSYPLNENPIHQMVANKVPAGGYPAKLVVLPRKLPFSSIRERAKITSPSRQRSCIILIDGNRSRNQLYLPACPMQSNIWLITDNFCFNLC